MTDTKDRITLDTNILIYAADRKDQHRHNASLKILEKATQLDCILTLQALSEFYHVVTRKNFVNAKAALATIDEWQTIFPVVAAKFSTLNKAVTLTIKHQLSFWDAMLLVTAQEAGTTILLSEDFNHHQMIDNIRIVNPFKPSEYWKA